MIVYVTFPKVFNIIKMEDTYMTNKIIIAICLLSITFFVSPCYSQAKDLVVQRGFLTGEKFLSMDNSEQAVYAMGLVDGVLSAVFFANSNICCPPWFENCIGGMSNSQITAILGKYLKEHPQEWHYSMHTIFYNAFLRTCPKK